MSTKRINHVLVDYENIKVIDLQELKRDDFRVTVFLGSNQQKLPSELVMQMQALGDRAEYIQISGSGPNALDFHIAFTIGEKCHGEVPTYFHIISNDSGFDPLIAYLKQKKKIYAGRYKSVSEIPIIKAALPTTPTERTEYFVTKIGSPGMTKPRTARTLSNSIRAVFNQQVSEEEANEIVSLLASRKFITVTEGKVTYNHSTPSKR